MPADKVVRMLFVCVENSNRSQLAEGFARLPGGERVEAYSAGS
jgi:arsenate reductase (thioredoxin)